MLHGSESVMHYMSSNALRIRMGWVLQFCNNNNNNGLLAIHISNIFYLVSIQKRLHY